MYGGWLKLVPLTVVMKFPWYFLISLIFFGEAWRKVACKETKNMMVIIFKPDFLLFMLILQNIGELE